MIPSMVELEATHCWVGEVTIPSISDLKLDLMQILLMVVPEQIL